MPPAGGRAVFGTILGGGGGEAGRLTEEQTLAQGGYLGEVEVSMRGPSESWNSVMPMQKS